MDYHLAKVLTNQMAPGNKCDVAVTYLNSKLHLNLTKDNVKNRLKNWKKYFNVVSNSHPNAKSMQNKMIENCDDIVLLCGKDRATGQGVETFEKGAPISGPRARPSSSIDSMHDKRKRPKKNSLGEVVSVIPTSFQEFLTNKKKVQKKPSGIEIHEVVSMVPELTSNEVFKVVRKLINDDVEEFNLLKAPPDEKKKE
ncbi:hypothetical protein Pfo_027179 [Paulownia fortunei]|nr:hypothetical protein Pfo_027179 [Paulownia fortunei]